MTKIAPQQKALPSLTDLYDDVKMVSKQNDLNRLLNQSPKEEWVKNHPFAKGVKYIPIEKIEWLLTSIFIKWRTEVKEVKVIANAVQVTVRLHVQDPISMDWDWHDGVGAVAMQTAKGAAATDFTQIIPDAVMKAVPAAKSYAIKDAAECLGRLFGKDLNRKELIPYTNLDGKIDLSAIAADREDVLELYSLLDNVQDHDERDQFQAQIMAGLSIEECQVMRGILLDKRITPLDRVRNGENVSQKQIKQAVNQRL